MGSASARIRNWLVLSANSHAADLDDVIRRYAKAKPSACVITKLDETLRIGGALSAVIANQLPVAYGCDGQRVPEAIEPGRATRSEGPTSALQSLVRISYAGFCFTLKMSAGSVGSRAMRAAEHNAQLTSLIMQHVEALF